MKLILTNIIEESSYNAYNKRHNYERKHGTPHHVAQYRYDSGRAIGMLTAKGRRGV